jgi:AcrR family transcriptional regulator
MNGKAGKLPRGRHNVPRHLVVANQRERILAAAAAKIAEEGYLSLSVRDILERAGVSRATFYEQFKDKHECVIVAYEVALEQLTAAVLEASEGCSDWPAGVAAGVDAALGYAAELPAQAHLLIVFPAAVADPHLSRRARAARERLVGLLHAGRQRQNAGPAPIEVTERAVLGAAMSVVGAHLFAAGPDRLAALKPELVQLILTPYLGEEEAVRIALAA